MPKGPKGEKRPADVIGTAIKIAKIATGEIEDEQPDDGKDRAAVELGRRGGTPASAVCLRLDSRVRPLSAR